LIGACVILFFTLAPIVHTSRFAYTVQVPAQGCSGLACGISSGYSVNKVCQETLIHYITEFGPEVCSYVKK
jgi:hypothetical protein